MQLRLPEGYRLNILVKRAMETIFGFETEAF
jgi:hypothetical protein